MVLFSFFQNNVRDKANVMFNTSLERIFGVKKYADSLTKIVEERDIKINFKRNLIAINSDTQEATFEILDGSQPKRLETYEVGCPAAIILKCNKSSVLKIG